MKLVTLALVASALAAPLARAQTSPASEAPPEQSTSTRARLHLDVEVDPTAYVFSGYSLHAGIGWKRLRLDLGVYAMDLPAFLHGNEGWSADFDGAGTKLQWFPFSEQRGVFVDASAGASRQRVTLDATGATQRDTLVGVGIDAGYRFALPYRFYVTTWAGVSYSFGADDVMLDGQRFHKSSVTPFAAVHLGYRFR